MEPPLQVPSSNSDNYMLDEQVQEDILMLRAHLGHFDHLLGEEPTELHILPQPLASTTLPSSSATMIPSSDSTDIQFKTPIGKPTQKKRVIETESDDEEKGASKKRKQPTPFVIDLDDEENSDEEEDLDAMKMKRYSSTDLEARNGPSDAKRPKLFDSPAQHDHIPLSSSAPSTPMITSFDFPQLLRPSGRYYDDSSAGFGVKRSSCRFCQTKRGLSWVDKSDRRLECFICGGPHEAKSCTNILCYNCWELGHRAADCENQKLPWAPCYRCGGLHDAFFCPTLPFSQPTTPLPTSSASTPIRPASSFSSPIVPPASPSLFCCQCAQAGHTARDCKLPTMDATKRMYDANNDLWLENQGFSFADFGTGTPSNIQRFQPLRNSDQDRPRSSSQHSSKKADRDRKKDIQQQRRPESPFTPGRSKSPHRSKEEQWLQEERDFDRQFHRQQDSRRKKSKSQDKRLDRQVAVAAKKRKQRKEGIAPSPAAWSKGGKKYGWWG